MRLTEKRSGYTHTVYKGKKKKCEVTIDRSSNKTKWYFYLSRKEDKLSYNCLWDGKEYDTLEECVEAAEGWIKENG